jgi:hypothetical protein
MNETQLTTLTLLLVATQTCVLQRGCVKTVLLHVIHCHLGCSFLFQELNPTIMVLISAAIKSCSLYPKTVNNNHRYRATNCMGGKERVQNTVVVATATCSGKITSNNRCPIQPHTMAPRISFRVEIITNIRVSDVHVGVHLEAIMMSIVPSGTQVVYKSSPSFSTPGDKPKITPGALPTFVQCSSSP